MSAAQRVFTIFHEFSSRKMLQGYDPLGRMAPTGYNGEAEARKA